MSKELSRFDRLLNCLDELQSVHSHLLYPDDLDAKYQVAKALDGVSAIIADEEKEFNF